ncbi:tail fiber domain-containing protein [Bacteroidota bacterium]
MIEKLSKINIQSWNYKSQDPSIKHVGITAQDYYQNFGFGENDITLTWIDVAGINSIAIQELYFNNQNAEKDNKELKLTINDQNKRINELETRLTEIEELLKKE